MFSGTLITPRCSPSAEMTQTPPGPVTQMLPRSSNFIPSGIPSSITPEPMPSKNMRPFESEPSAFDVEDLDVSPRRVVDVQERLVRREAEAVRHLELVLVDDELDVVRAAAGRDPEDALQAEVPLALDARTRACARTTGRRSRSTPSRAHADVVGAVQLLALVVRGEHAPASRRAARARASS